MKLTEAIAKLDELDRETIICVRRPWSPDSECVVTAPNEQLGVPNAVIEAGFDYFLEVHVAHEVLEVLEGRPASHDERVRLLLFYGENDAYPVWAHGDAGEPTDMSQLRD